ncbi:MAG: RecQ family ATP-dependent DNA helicase [Prevotella sp.]|nr:RecQ family ATP-dependent DNA helicase [Prevotella sp.]
MTHPEQLNLPEQGEAERPAPADEGCNCSGPSISKHLSILHQYWGYKDFRGIQREIIESISQGRDTLGLMPTGGGKSITFQVPALAMEGVCIVITPLIALMKDQVEHLRKIGIQASAIYSGMSHREILVTLDNCIFGGVKILYVSPERLSSEIFQTKMHRIRVSFITVDEAHCISQWGYDFRPSYLEIAKIRKIVSQQRHIPVLALTATATPRVIDDIQQRLEFEQPNVFKMSFERKNLAYIVRITADKFGQMVHILNSVPGTAIIYVRSRRRTKEIAEFLCKSLSADGVTPPSSIATFYHAGLDHSVRDERQRLWHDGKVRVMVATNAFGMGIDKPDVRIVIHMDCPSSLEAYFQEAGRAGRDGRKAYAVMLYNNADHRKLEQRISETFPEKDYILKVYEHIAYFYQMAVGDGLGVTHEFDINKFCRTFRHFPVQADAALKILSRAGWIHYETDPDGAARVMFLLTRDELYRLKNTSPHEEATITTLLRNYGGLFTDYAYIDLNRIALEASLTPEQVYLCLKALSQRRIVHFIPQRRVPTITYTQRREETSRVVIPSSVYEDRRVLFEKRIRAVWKYAENTSICRSQMLLRYFGEELPHECHQCDICLNAPTTSEDDMLKNEKWQNAQEAILQLVSDHQKHFINELNELHLPTDHLQSALKFLISEEILIADSNQIYLA